MDCTVEGCDDTAVGKCIVDNGTSTERKPACEEHEGERFETALAYERSKDSRRERMQREYYDFDEPQGLNTMM